MTTHPYPDLKRKLRLLRAIQRKRYGRYLWRSVLLSTFAGGILAVAVSPQWYIKEESQIVLNGDRYMDSAQIYNAVRFPYPQPLAIVPSQKITRQLKLIPAVESVRVTKKIFPPSINIHLKERVPVATAVSSGRVGFLDSQGVWLDPNYYDLDKADLPLTPIKVVNFQPQYSPIWSEIFQLISSYSTLEIDEIRWDEMGNLFMIVGTHKVIFGSDYSLLKKQFSTLANFTDLANNEKLQDISQIDLTNPDVPILETPFGT